MGWGGEVQCCLCGSPGDPAAILKGSALTARLGRVRNAEVKGLPPSPSLALLPPRTQGSPFPAQSKPRALSPLQAAERVLAPHNPMPPRRLQAAPRVPGCLFPGEGSSSRGIHHFPATPCPSSPLPSCTPVLLLPEPALPSPEEPPQLQGWPAAPSPSDIPGAPGGDPGSPCSAPWGFGSTADAPGWLSGGSAPSPSGFGWQSSRPEL